MDCRRHSSSQPTVGPFDSNLVKNPRSQLSQPPTFHSLPSRHGTLALQTSMQARTHRSPLLRTPRDPDPSGAEDTLSCRLEGFLEMLERSEILLYLYEQLRLWSSSSGRAGRQNGQHQIASGIIESDYDQACQFSQLVSADKSTLGTSRRSRDSKCSPRC